MTAVRKVPVPDTAPDRRHVGPARSVLVAAALACGILAGTFGAAAASAMPAQDPGITSTAPGAAGATTSTAVGATTSTTAAETTDADTNNAASEDRKIWLVVAGLVTVALALTALTIRYWRQTRPVRVAVPDAPPVAEPGPGSGPEPEAEPEPEPEPERDDRVAPGEHGRHSRRAVAGADHATVDDEWEPRGTGEHERIEVPATTRTTRPTREQRQAAFRSIRRQG